MRNAIWRVPLAAFGCILVAPGCATEILYTDAGKINGIATYDWLHN